MSKRGGTTVAPQQVAHPVHGQGLRGAERAPPRAESGDGKRRFGTRPALNVKLAVSYVTRDAGIHALNLRTATGPVNAKAMTDL